MALLFMDGFDHMVGSIGLTTKWASGGGSVSATGARTGTHGVVFSGTDLISKPIVYPNGSPAAGGFCVGFAIKQPTSWSASSDYVQIREGTTVHLALSGNGTDRLTVKVGSTVVATGTQPLAINGWYYVEFKGIIADTGGSFDVRIDTIPDPTLTLASGDTRNVGTTGQWDRIRISGTSNTYIDDLYVCDLSGPAPYNTFLGSCKVETLMPVTDAVAAGTNQGLTPSTGTDHGALVDETTPNITDYNSSPTVGAKDTYNFPSLVLSGAVLGVQTNLYAAKNDTGARSMCHVVRAGSPAADYDATNEALSTGFVYSSRMWALNPATGVAWTAADVAAMEAGMKVTV